MKKILSGILLLMTLVLAACSESPDEPGKVVWGEGEAPISMHPLAPEQSRANLQFDGVNYDFYGYAVLYGVDMGSGHLTYTKLNGVVEFVQPMAYDNELDLLYFHRAFFPYEGTVDIFSFGMPSGKSIDASVSPVELPEGDNIDYLVLDLTRGYDGTFDIISTDRITVPCRSDLQPSELPYARFHHILSHIDIKVKWDNNHVSASDPIVSRFHVNSIRLLNTSAQGICHLEDKVKDAVWVEPGDDVVLTNNNVSKLVDYTDGIDLGGSYIVPQASRQNIAINYTIVNGTGASQQSTTANYIITTDSSQAWLAGHRYHYELEIGPKGTVSVNRLKVEVEPFGEGKVGQTIID